AAAMSATRAATTTDHAERRAIPCARTISSPLLPSLVVQVSFRTGCPTGARRERRDGSRTQRRPARAGRTRDASEAVGLEQAEPHLRERRERRHCVPE